MLEEKGGWFVVNVSDTKWLGSSAFGKRVRFEKDESFPQTGVGISIVQPGQPACRYHREDAQEDFLVLSGECLLLVNGEKRQLKTWDYVHCPPGVTHVFIGAGNGPCAILMIGHRPEEQNIFYPESELARPYNAEAPEPTSEPPVAYSDVERWAETEPGEWPL